MRSISSKHLPLVAAVLVAVALFASPPAEAAPPSLQLPGPQTVSEGTLLTFNVSATDPDGQTVELRASNLPTGASFVDHHNNTGTFSWTPNTDQAGSYQVFFLADDTFGGTANGSVSIDVVNANTPPVLSAIGDRTVEQGTMQFVSLSGFDADGDALSFMTSALPAYATFSDYGDGSGNITLAPTTSTPLGATTITVTLSDGLSDVSQSFTVTVTGTQTANPPVLAPIGSQTVAEGEVVHVALSASDPDGGTLTWGVALPGFATLTPTGSGSGTLSATLDLAPGYCGAGTYTATVTVSDGVLQDSETFSIAVTNVNRAPSWNEASYAASLLEEAEAVVSVSASDPDGACGQGAPRLGVQSSDGGSALSATLLDAGNGTGTLSLAAGPTAAGVYHVTLRASDRDDAALASDVVVTVTVLNAPTRVEARSWSESDPLRLDIGKPRERFYLEPVHGFSLEDVNLASISLSAWEGSGSVASIAPLAETVEGGHDRDMNGVVELRMDFSKDDLRALFAYVSDRSAANMTLKATLMDGTLCSAAVNVSLVPQRKGVIKRVGPNPLNPEATVTVVTERDGRLRVRVFDVNGRLARTLLDQASIPAGMHTIRFDGRNDRGVTLPSGRYFVHAETSDSHDVSPITILK
jgi:hypothetical protein